jgi:hypothetical protein
MGLKEQEGKGYAEDIITYNGNCTDKGYLVTIVLSIFLASANKELTVEPSPMLPRANLAIGFHPTLRQNGSDHLGQHSLVKMPVIRL